MSLYADDAKVAEVTNYLVGTGARIFQIFQRGDERRHAQFLLSEMSPPVNAHVLDVGCGIGEVARLMKEWRTDLDFTLLNISPSQLAMCPPQFPQLCSSGEDIPAPDDTFDVAMACYAIGHMDKDAALAEMRRVVKPGGIIFIVDIEGADLSELDYACHEWDGFNPSGLKADAFKRVMPDFEQRFPNARPVVYREIKQ